MTEFPFHRPDPWFQDEVDDYNRARSDDERRRILLRFGYDDAHQSEAERLFPPPDVAASGEEDQNGNEPNKTDRHDIKRYLREQLHELLSLPFLIGTFLSILAILVCYLAWRYPC